MDSKAENLLTLDVKNISSFADKIIIATARSNRHAMSVSEKLVECVKKHNLTILGVEGEVESGWILVDCGDVCLLYTSPSPRDATLSRMPSSA